EYYIPSRYRTTLGRRPDRWTPIASPPRESRDMHDRTTLRALVFDSLDSQIAIIDHTGAIIDVNEAWTRFGAENGISSGFSCVGSNYIELRDWPFAAGDGVAGEAAKGMADGLASRRASFYPE